MDRKIYKLPFGNQGVTKYPCPTCGSGVLRAKKDTFHYEETKLSASSHRHEAFEPDWIQYLYGCIFECTNTACGDYVASTGWGSVSEEYIYDEEGNPDIDYDEFFYPKYFEPHLKLFDLPENTPDEVAAEIQTSFSLFFSDPSSSANHIRIALEHILTHLKIKRFVTRDGRRNYLSLHGRIELLPAKFDHVKELFFAIKWLGNAGSHSSHEISKDDVLDACELMDELLVEIFTGRRKKVKRLAKKIIRKKGPK